MKLVRKVNLGGFENMDFESSERSTPQECARDLVAAMMPLSASSAPIRATIDTLKKAYNI